MIVIKVSEVRKSRYAPKNEVYEFEVIKRQQEGYSGTKPNMVNRPFYYGGKTKELAEKKRNKYLRELKRYESGEK